MLLSEMHYEALKCPAEEDASVDLDEMISRKKGGSSEEHSSKKQKDVDLISF